MRENNGKSSVYLKWILNIFLGAFIGVGAILPGLSGGVMCVIFGVYQPLMETLAHPVSGAKKHWKLLLPIIVGIAVGFVCFGGVLDILLEKNAPLMQAIFVGLIVGTIPALWKEAGAEKRTKASWVTLVCSFVVMFLIFGVLGSKGDEATDIAKIVGKYISIGSINTSPNFFWFVVCGVICGISIIVPGMSFSAPLMCLGLFEPMTANLKALMHLDGSVILSFLLPLAIGGLATVLLLAKPVNWLFGKYNSVAYHFVLGTVFASTVLLVPINCFSASVSEGFTCLAGLFGGILVGYLLDELQSKVKVE